MGEKEDGPLVMHCRTPMAEMKNSIEPYGTLLPLMPTQGSADVVDEEEDVIPSPPEKEWGHKVLMPYVFKAQGFAPHDRSGLSPELFPY